MSSLTFSSLLCPLYFITIMNFVFLLSSLRINLHLSLILSSSPSSSHSSDCIVFAAFVLVVLPLLPLLLLLLLLLILDVEYIYGFV